MADSYVTSGAKLRCSFGDKISELIVYPDRTANLTGKPVANVSDHIPMRNIVPFGKCHTIAYPPTGSATAAHHGHLTPMPCVPCTNFKWINGKDDYKIKGDSALLKSSYCKCCYGGIISIVDDGQVDSGEADLSRTEMDSEEKWEREEEKKLLENENSILDGFQTVLDMAGYATGVGAIPDLLNAAIYAIRGDEINAGLSLLAAVPMIGDVAAAAKLANKGVKAAKNIQKANKTSNLATVVKEPSEKMNSAKDAELLSITMKRHLVKDSDLVSPTTLSEEFEIPSNSSNIFAKKDVVETTKKVVSKDSDSKLENGTMKDPYEYKGNNLGNKVKQKGTGKNLNKSC